ncbi:YjjG family noncanonical pyrimidine nucleotidase [Mesonia sp. K7]|uniref:YjjG family noncanonical pyrimidine nucleotidase n=1 Tax=Mesonia sp. K7 TaxID=2218606 RepID=UPI000DAA3CF1|nr:YjjG family noncanonical pyrimidine nucleotidase [Mesonia sp. K7]PZD76997.1 noncanonical pyrimidine nucleotidase, YjjG family [Mesonia sp. K7]
MKNKITDIFFDLDHTLWDFEKNSDLAFRKIFEINRVEVNISEFLKVYKPINLEYWRLYREDKISKESLRFSRLHQAFLKLGNSQPENLIHQLSEDYIAYLPDHNFLLEDVDEILSALAQYYKLHIITNGFTKVQYKKLQNSHIDHYFCTVTTSEDVGVKKPNPKIFEYAMKKAKVNSVQSLMIGDSLEADIYGAQNAGLETVLFDPEESLTYEGLKIKKLKELKTLLL